MNSIIACDVEIQIKFNIAHNCEMWMLLKLGNRCYMKNGVRGIAYLIVFSLLGLMPLNSCMYTGTARLQVDFSFYILLDNVENRK